MTAGFSKSDTKQDSKKVILRIPLGKNYKMGLFSDTLQYMICIIFTIMLYWVFIRGPKFAGPYYDSGRDTPVLCNVHAPSFEAEKDHITAQDLPADHKELNVGVSVTRSSSTISLSMDATVEKNDAVQQVGQQKENDTLQEEKKKSENPPTTDLNLKKDGAKNTKQSRVIIVLMKKFADDMKQKFIDMNAPGYDDKTRLRRFETVENVTERKSNTYDTMPSRFARLLSMGRGGIVERF